MFSYDCLRMVVLMVAEGVQVWAYVGPLEHHLSTTQATPKQHTDNTQEQHRTTIYKEYYRHL
jgi:hypothetical protein